ncbi:MAG: hypothetical protein ACD_28C00433G0002 [uncultured bacterium]|nr:MAG: hypothetical protein ACD_28C00433G0002 [uncultured bacterium]
MRVINSKIGATLFCLLLVAILGTIDYITGYEVSFSIFYLIPVCLASWLAGFPSGIIISSLSMGTWALSDYAAGHRYSNPNFFYWNGAMRGLIFVSFSFMVSKMASLIKELGLSRLKAVEASQAKSMFLANMSHEIRTPMNAILGVTDLLKQTPLNKEQTEYVRIFRAEGDHLLLLINDILDLSKIEAGKFDVENLAFDLTRIIEEIVSIMGSRAREKGLELNHRVETDVPKYIVGAPHCLRRILLNLIGNSIKFTGEGHIALNVSMNHDQRGEILFCVNDTGIGIPKDRINCIFMPFEQADDTISQKYGGTGLGLSITQKLLDMMGGRIWVKSQFGAGSAFMFVIPFDLPTEQQMNAVITLQNEQAHAMEIPIDKRILRVLLVDDYETNRLLIKSFLKKTPYLIDEAENGEVAFNKFKANKYNIVLMDIQMPVMGGYIATRLIRLWEKENNVIPTPIIALTAFAYKEDADKAKEAGCDLHLPKPIDMTRLLRVIYELSRCEPGILLLAGNDRMKKVIKADANLKEVTERFLAEAKTFAGEIAQGIEESDFEKVSGIGHKLKGVGGSFGFSFISEAGGNIEQSARTKDAAALRGHHQALLEYLNNLEVEYE